MTNRRYREDRECRYCGGLNENIGSAYCSLRCARNVLGHGRWGQTDEQICATFGWDIDAERAAEIETAKAEADRLRNEFEAESIVRREKQRQYEARRGRRGLSQTIRDQVIHSSGNHCYYCGATPNSRGPFFQVDHIVPRGKGGQTELSNLVATCHRCNQVKASHNVEAFRRIMGGGLFWSELVQDEAA